MSLSISQGCSAFSHNLHFYFTESSWCRSSYLQYPMFSEDTSVSSEGVDASFIRSSGSNYNPASFEARNLKEFLPTHGPGQYSCDKCGKVGDRLAPGYIVYFFLCASDV